MAVLSERRGKKGKVVASGRGKRRKLWMSRTNSKQGEPRGLLSETLLKHNVAVIKHIPFTEQAPFILQNCQ